MISLTNVRIVLRMILFGCRNINIIIFFINDKNSVKDIFSLCRNLNVIISLINDKISVKDILYGVAM